MRILILLLFLLFGKYSFTQDISKNMQQIAAKYQHSLFGENTLIFDPDMDMSEGQMLLDSIYESLTFPDFEFSSKRYAILFKPGIYHLNIKVGYYTHIMGLGNSPEDVIIKGSVGAYATKGHVLCNFWRSVENITIEPESGTNIWGVSQAAPLRRVNIRGDLKLFDGPSSGGFMANCKIDGTVYSGSQQQWLSRNSSWAKWEGGVWNMMFMGVVNPPQGKWPEKPYTIIDKTPFIREKPFLSFTNNTICLKTPPIKKESKGVDWNKEIEEYNTISLDKFYIAKANKDNSTSINKALELGMHILFTPGIYSLSESIRVHKKGSILIGIGMTTLVPKYGNKAIVVDDLDDVILAGLLIDASKKPSETLMQIGEGSTKKRHKKNPIFLFDVFFRVGGAHEGKALSCLTINSNDVYVDHAWIWRADHGEGVGWEKNTCASGLIVNGNNVTFYGLFNEHFQEYQTLWKGENGKVYFYQSEMPYDPPTPEIWKHNNIYGYASYKVDNKVKKHEAWGIGIYNVFWDAPIVVDQAIETGVEVENNFHHKVIFWLNGNQQSEVRSIINGKGGGINASDRKRTMN